MTTTFTFRSPPRTGFTLVELLIVVLIIGALLAIALPVYEKTVREARETTVKADLRSIFTAGQIVKTRTGFYPTGMTDPNMIAEFQGNANRPTGVIYSYTPPTSSASGVITATETTDVFGSSVAGEAITYTFQNNAAVGVFGP